MAQPFVQMPMPGGAVRTFRTVKNFEVWLNETEEFWRWLLEAPMARPGCVRLAASSILEFLNGCREHVARFNDEGHHAGDRIIDLANGIFPAGVPISPDDEMLAAVIERFSDLGDDALKIAVAAAIYMESSKVRTLDQHQLFDIAHPYALQAVGFAATARHGTKRGQLKALRAAIERAADATDRLVAIGDAEQAAFEDRSNQILGRHIELSVAQAHTSQRESAAAIERIDATKSTYEELMRLKSPTDYWATKGDDHRNSARTYRRWLTGLSIGAVLVLALAYWGGWLALYEFTNHNPKGGIAMTLYIAGFVGAVTAVVLWFIRIVVRLYMSQHHLAADAEERASMIRTYLALTETGKVSEEERALVLASVFRPVPDGIVKDDGAPAYSPAGLLAMLLDKK